MNKTTKSLIKVCTLLGVAVFMAGCATARFEDSDVMADKKIVWEDASTKGALKPSIKGNILLLQYEQQVIGYEQKTIEKVRQNYARGNGQDWHKTTSEILSKKTVKGDVQVDKKTVLRPIPDGTEVKIIVNGGVKFKATGGKIDFGNQDLAKQLINTADKISDLSNAAIVIKSLSDQKTKIDLSKLKCVVDAASRMESLRSDVDAVKVKAVKNSKSYEDYAKSLTALVNRIEYRCQKRLFDVLTKDFEESTTKTLNALSDDRNKIATKYHECTISGKVINYDKGNV
jgi:hypothetical protein